jgi:hypothetical protein
MVLELQAMARESARALEREREGSEARCAAHELPGSSCAAHELPGSSYCSSTQTEESSHGGNQV